MADRYCSLFSVDLRKYSNREKEVVRPASCSEGDFSRSHEAKEWAFSGEPNLMGYSYQDEFCPIADVAISRPTAETITPVEPGTINHIGRECELLLPGRDGGVRKKPRMK